jgi:hypothetical protein
MKPTTCRIAHETYQRSSKAMANNEGEGAEFEMWWYRLAGLLQCGMAGPRTIQLAARITFQARFEN